MTGAGASQTCVLPISLLERTGRGRIQDEGRGWHIPKLEGMVSGSREAAEMERRFRSGNEVRFMARQGEHQEAQPSDLDT